MIEKQYTYIHKYIYTHTYMYYIHLYMYISSGPDLGMQELGIPLLLFRQAGREALHPHRLRHSRLATPRLIDATSDWIYKGHTSEFLIPVRSRTGLIVTPLQGDKGM